MTPGAVFLDRDGTIIRDMSYISDAEQVQLMPGAAKAIRRLNDADLPVIVVTNQSGIARGLLTHGDYEAVHERMEELLDRAGAHVDATYMCPHHPDFDGPCECRKPGTLLFQQAADAFGVDTTSSWFIGDRLRDVLPARALGGQGILLPSNSTPPLELREARHDFVVSKSLDEAVRRVIESDG